MFLTHALRAIFRAAVVTGDSLWKFVTLLISGTPPAVTFISDASTSGNVLTLNGDTRPSNFNPYTPGYYSNYFDGTGDYLTFPSNAAFVFGTGDFTIEFWVNQQNWNPSGGAFYSHWISINSYLSGIMVRPNTTGTGIQVYVGGTDYLFSTTLSLNTWFHVAVSRSSSSMRVFVNGTQIGTTQTVSYNISTNTANAIGTAVHDTSEEMQGYLSNVRVVKGTALYTSSFTPSTTPLTPVTNTSLLTCQSNRLIDNSINNFTITKVGDTSVQRFSPFSPSSVTPTSYSGYFDGTGDMIQTPSITIGTNAFCFECWLYPTVTQGTTTGIFVGSATNSLQASYYGNPGLGIATKGTAWQLYEETTLPTVNAWNHVAFVRSGTGANQTSIYINGVRVANGTVASNFAASVYQISTTNAGGSVFQGYISNARLTNGSTPYDATQSTITVPTSPLTAISGTSLLTCQSPTFIDNSTNNFAITANGNSQPTIQNPFGSTSATTEGYTVSTIGGSGYFDGTGDYLTGPTSNASLLIGTGDFTIEYWAYKTTSTSVATVVSFGSGGGNLRHFIDNVTPTVWDGASQLGGGNTINLNSWNHIVVQRSGTTLRFYTNGISSATITNSSNFNAGTISIGGGDANAITGYISDLRIVKGRALYTSNFVPPSAPLTAVQNTVLLTNMTSAGIYDAAMMNNLETVGDAKLSTAVSKFGGSSMSFDGSGDYLSANPIGAGDLGTGDFTIEYWMNASAVGSYSGPAGTQEVAGFATAGMWRCLNRFNSSNGIYFAYTTGSTFVDITFTATNYNDGTWHHVAYVKSGTSLKAYVDGTQVGTAATVTQSLTSGKKLTLGYNPQDNAYYTGYVDDLRITKGYARYTSNFTPPTSALQIK